MILSRYRSSIFALFVILFGCTALLVLFHAFGYRYSFERGIFIFSGSVTIKTTPESVDIAIDSALVPKKRLGLLNNSVHIAGLMPGEHTLRLTAPEHQSWEKQITIESGISREFWNIILPRITYPIQPLPSTSEAIKIFPHPSDNTQFMLIKEVNNELSLVILNYETGLSQQVFSLVGSRFTPFGNQNLEWSWFENGRYVILPVTSQEKQEHLIIDTTDGSFTSLETRTGLVAPRIVRWNTKKSGELLFLSEQTLYNFKLTPEATPLSISEGVLTYSFSDDTLYLVTASGEIWEDHGERLTTIAPALPIDQSVQLSLTVYERDRIALLEEGGQKRLWLIYPDPRNRLPLVKTVSSGVRTIQFSNDGKKLLFATDYEIGVIFANDWEVQPRREAGETVQVARFSEPISHVQWTENYEHILFSRGNIVKFIELDGRDRRIIADIHHFTTPPTQILPRFVGNEFFIITPGQAIHSLIFPEPQTLFGQ